MKKITKLSLVPILASCLLVATAIAPVQAAAKHHRQASTACAANPGTMRALFCPAPAAPGKPAHHRHAKA